MVDVSNGGVSAFSDAFNTMRNVGDDLVSSYQQGQVKRQVSRGMKSAEKDRDADIQGMISAGGTTDNPAYTVGNKTFSSEDAAKKFASDHVAAATDYFNNKYAPAITNTLMKQGHADLAESWQKYIQDGQSQSALNYFGKANAARMLGDREGMAANLGAAINAQGGADGHKVEGVQEVTNPQGQVSGYNVIMRNSDGQQVTRQIDGNEHSLFQLAGSYMPGLKQFENWNAQQSAAGKLQAQAALKNMEINGQDKRQQMGDNTKIQIAGLQSATSRANEADSQSGQDRRQKSSDDAAFNRTALTSADRNGATENDINTRNDALNNIQGLSPDQRVQAQIGIATGRSIPSAQTQQGAPPDGGKIYDTLTRTDLNFGNKNQQDQVNQVKSFAANRQAAMEATQGLASANGGYGVTNPTPQATPAMQQPAQSNVLFDPSTNATVSYPGQRR